MKAIIDGRGFTKLTKEKCDFERPFDMRFRDAMKLFLWITHVVKRLRSGAFGPAAMALGAGKDIEQIVIGG